MHTAESIEAMNNQAACKTAETMARSLFGTDHFKTALAERVGVKRQTVNNWFSTKPPVLVMLYLQAELGRRDLERTVSDFRKGLKGILQAP